MNRRTFINGLGTSLLASNHINATQLKKIKSTKNLVIFTSEYGFNDCATKRECPLIGS
ncbi:hypothetical protein PQO01_05495 [Lentisphaera marina]|uniref:hypothetical protein n=1 Tax=Lentisphaera marina TaxID=1111041 RepID=UPI0023651FB9|nr:hypothetical protein [Lentisphaera marina]MDD7984400.1 hypothetical protein [Lentisphaera marina]